MIELKVIGQDYQERGNLWMKNPEQEPYIVPARYDSLILYLPSFLGINISSSFNDKKHQNYKATI